MHIISFTLECIYINILLYNYDTRWQTFRKPGIEILLVMITDSSVVFQYELVIYFSCRLPGNCPGKCDIILIKLCERT